MTRHVWARQRSLRAVLVVLVGVSCTGAEIGGDGGTPSDGPPSPTEATSRTGSVIGWVRQDGSRLIDESGDPVRLVGVHFRSMAPGAGIAGSWITDGARCPGWKAPDRAAYDNIDGWGFNSVRLSISWANLEPTPPSTRPDGSLAHHYNQEYLKALDGIIEEMGARDIAVILSMQQNKWSPAFARTRDGVPTGCPGLGMPVWLYEDTGIHRIQDAKASFFRNDDGVWTGFAEAWRFVAERYAQNPVVIGADLLNEPYASGKLTTEALHLDDLYREVGAAIRSVNSRILLVFEDSRDELNGDFALTGPPPFENLVYSFHLYRENWNPIGLSVTEHFQLRAASWNVPLWVGEFNMFRATKTAEPPLPGWEESTGAMLTYWRDHDIGWAVHAYSGEHSLVDRGSGAPRMDLIRILQSGF